MPNFRYKAITADGEMIDGEMEARDDATVIRRLEGMGYLPVEASEAAGGGTSPADRPASGLALPFLNGRRVKSQDITLFTRELAMLLAAGVTLEQGLMILSRDIGSQRLSRLVTKLLADVREGKSFQEALAAHPTAFPPVYVNMIGAAEASGTLELVLERLADYRERAEKLREKVVGALLYPAILLTAAAGAIILLLAFVVPQFEQIFEDAGAALPTSTQIVIAAARGLEDYGLFMLVGLLVVLIAFRQALLMPGFRARWDAFILRIPLLGRLLKEILSARFCRTFGTLLSNGVDLPLALRLSRDVVDNRAAEAAVDNVIAAVRDGKSLAEPLAEAEVLPPMAVQMMRVGEETGKLWPTALHLADMYERKVETSLQRLFIFLEPALVIGVGLLIAGIIVSILLAVVSVNDLAF